MFNNIKKIFIFLFFIIISDQVYSEKIKIVFKIDNQIITTHDLKKEFLYLSSLNPSINAVNQKEINKIAKESIIKEKIKEQDLLKYYDLNESNSYVDEIIKNIYLNMNMKNIEEFSEYLKKFNLNISEVKKKIKIEVTWNELIYQKYNKQIFINEDEIKKKIIGNNTEIDKLLLSEILISGKNKQEITSTINFIIKKINEIGFNKTATLYSNADSSKNQGNIGWVRIEQLSSKIKNEINKTQTGKFTNPITVPGGAIIIMIEDRKKEKVTLDIEIELKKAINFEKNNKLNQFSNIYFNKLKNQSIINVY